MLDTLYTKRSNAYQVLLTVLQNLFVIFSKYIFNFDRFHLFLCKSGNYEMLQSEDEVQSTRPLYLYLTAEESTTKGPIYASPYGAGDGEFNVISKGRHEFCIVNGINHNPIDGTRRRADGAERTIAFTIHLRPQYQSESGPDSLPVANTLNLANKLGDNLVLLLDHFEYLKKQEQIHQDLATKTLGLLWKWTTLEAVVLVGIAVAQIHYLRRFFETKRYL